MEDLNSGTAIQLLQNYQSLENDFNSKKIEGIEFNSFNLIHSIFGITETKHTKLLAFFLDPNESHGQGIWFLKQFLGKIEGFDLKKDVDMYNWGVTTEDINADIVIKTTSPEKISIVIENKSNEAKDQESQLYRYWYDHIYSFFDKDIDKAQDRSKCRIIYLTSGYSNKMVSEFSIEKPDFINLGYPKLDKKKKFITNWTFYKDIKGWLEDCIKRDLFDEKHRLKLYIEDYIQFWDNAQLKNDFFMEHLKNELYKSESTWNSFIEMCRYKEDLITVLKNKFVENLKFLIEGSCWKFDKEKDNDFRFFLNDWGSTSLVYEWHIGLTIWKWGGDKIKACYRGELEKYFQGYFNFIEGGLDGNKSYMMVYANNTDIKFSTYEEFLWKAVNDEKFLNEIKKVFDLFKNGEIETLFNKMDQDQTI